MTFDPVSPSALSRRSWLQAAGAGATGVTVAALAGCGSSKSKSRAGSTVTTVRGPDVPILSHALYLERTAIAAYTAATPLLSGTAHEAAQRFLSQELTHASELGGLIAQAGGKPSKPRASYNLGHPRTTRELLELLHRLEQAQIQAYIAAVPLLSKGTIRAAVAAICANDAQHVSILRLELDRNPVPSAFVSGSE